MRVEKFDDIGIYQRALEVQQMGNLAIERLRKENKAKGIPIVFSRNGIIYYEMPDGNITTQSPFLKEK